MKPLILGSCYVADFAMRDLCQTWIRLAQHLHPGVDVLVVDSASPIAAFDGWIGNDCFLFHRFDDNVGHLSRGGGDGWGRAFCFGIEYAVEHNYTHIAYMDCDIMSRHPVTPILKKMAHRGVTVACPLDFHYQFVENGIAFMETHYLQESGFIERYDWAHPPAAGAMAITETPEARFEQIVADDLFILPFRGCRNDFGQVTRSNIRDKFPFGCDYLTHCRDAGLYERFLEVNGIRL